MRISTHYAFLSPRVFYPEWRLAPKTPALLRLHLCSGYCHKLGIKGPLKRIPLNELDSKAKT